MTIISVNAMKLYLFKLGCVLPCQPMKKSFNPSFHTALDYLKDSSG